MRRERRELGVAVVFADEDNRQLPQTRDVQRFMKSPSLTGAIAKKNDGDLSLAFFLRRKCGTERERNSAAHDSRRRDKACIHCDDMHRATFAGAVARRAAGDLRHEAIDVRAFGNSVAVRSMAAKN